MHKTGEMLEYMRTNEFKHAKFRMVDLRGATFRDCDRCVTWLSSKRADAGSKCTKRRLGDTHNTQTRRLAIPPSTPRIVPVVDDESGLAR